MFVVKLESIELLNYRKVARELLFVVLWLGFWQLKPFSGCRKCGNTVQKSRKPFCKLEKSIKKRITRFVVSFVSMDWILDSVATFTPNKEDKKSIFSGIINHQRKSILTEVMGVSTTHWKVLLVNTWLRLNDNGFCATRYSWMKMFYINGFDISLIFYHTAIA